MTDLQDCIDVLTAHMMARTQWDEDPQLFTIDRTPHGVKATPVPIPEFMWSLQRPALVLRAIAASLTTAPHGSPVLEAGADVIAVALRVEQYSLDSSRDIPAASAEAARRVFAGGSVPPLRTIEGRIEQRGISLVTLDGEQAMIAGDRLVDDSTGPAEILIAGPGDEFGGECLEALVMFRDAIAPHMGPRRGRQ